MTATSSSIRNFIPMQNKYDRIVLLVDMDCFYCQVEEKLNPEIKGQPVAVVQYNAWRGGGIIAVNYAARAKGVTRHIRGDEAKDLCPEIVLVKVPNIREKADLSKYRDAGKEVANVLQRYTKLLERASVDEAYLDITESVNKRLENMNAGEFVLQPHELVNTYAVGYANIGEYVNRITQRMANPYMDDETFQRAHDQNDLPVVRQSDLRLLIGASIAGEIRTAVKSVTGYECSAGIAHNKILAKLACGMNKPNKQTILPLAEIPALFETLPVGKIKGLGGKYGEEVCELLKIKYIGQLLKYTESELQRKFDEKNGTWLYNISRGIDLEAVTPRFYSKSIGCCKKFPGRNNITGLKTLQHWLNELANEINDRLEKDAMENNRKAKQMVVSFIQDFDGEEISSSRSAPLSNYDQDTLAKYALDVIKANTKIFFKPGSETALNNPIKFLGISVGKFETISNAQTKLQEMFANQAAKKRRISEDATEQVPNVSSVENEKMSSLEINKVEKPKVKGEEKMKSFFANYLQKGENENKLKTIEETKKLEEPSKSGDVQTQQEENVVPQSAASKSFFLNVLKKKPVDNEQECNKKSIIQPEKNPIPNEEATRKSFFLKALKAQTPKSQIQLENNNNPAAASVVQDTAELEIQQLAAHLQDIEDSNKRVDTLCEEILSLNSDNSQSKLEDVENNSAISIEHIQKVETSHLKRKFNEINKNETEIPTATSSQAAKGANDYKNTYAEYALPVLSEDLLKFVKCEQCGADIPDEPRSLQTHRDHHFAQQLSQQQRAEFRAAELQTKVNTNKTTKSPPNAKKKSKKPTGGQATTNAQSSSSAGAKADITKFLKTKSVPPISAPPMLMEPSTSAAAAAAESLELCSECQTYIKVTEISEHMDFHVAQQLQRKLNQLEVRTVTIVKKPNTSKKSLNSTSTATLNHTQRSSNKSIAQFFTQTH